MRHRYHIKTGCLIHKDQQDSCVIILVRPGKSLVNLVQHREGPHLLTEIL